VVRVQQRGTRRSSCCHTDLAAPTQRGWPGTARCEPLAVLVFDQCTHGRHRSPPYAHLLWPAPRNLFERPRTATRTVGKRV